MTIRATEATQAVEAALAKSAELGTTVTITVVDSAGELAAFARQDGAAPINFDISYGQAYTVTKFGGMRGGKIARLADYNWFRGASAMRGGRLLASEGALPAAARRGARRRHRRERRLGSRRCRDRGSGRRGARVATRRDSQAPRHHHSRSTEPP